MQIKVFADIEGEAVNSIICAVSESFEKINVFE